ncbi:MAG: PAS domain S-box protein [Actinobacteria bacterium]|jgi:PAS domain S-box-containing protein|nr:MAG: PAS domain S-box protein [Actinomycetota bacterium]
MLKELSGTIATYLDDLVGEMQSAFEDNLPTYAGLSPETKEDIHELIKKLAQRTTTFMASSGGDREDLYAFARMIGRNRSLQSIPFADLVRAIFLVESIIWNRVIPEVKEMDLDLTDLQKLLDMQSELNSNLIAALSAAYSETKDEMINRQLRELHGLLEVGRTIASTMDLDRVFLQIIEVAAGIMQTPMGAVYLLEEDGEELRLVTQLGLSQPWAKGRRVHLARSLLAQAMEEKTPVAAADTRLRGLNLPAPARGGKVRSVLSCPILKDEEPTGGLELYDVEPRTYNRLDMALLAAFAPQAGVAIENARLFELERKRRRQTVELKELAEAIAGAMSFKQAMGILVRSLVMIMGADKCLLFFYDQDADRLEFARGYGLTSAMTSYLQNRVWDMEGLDEAISLVIKEQLVITTEDARSDPRINEEYARFLKVRACIIAPLIYGGKVSGVLAIGSNTKARLFEEEEPEMIAVVLDQVTIAIEQVRLRERIRKRERRLRELEASERVFIERERSEAIISTNPEAIFLVDRGRNIIVFNPAGAELFGWREEEAVGRHVHEVLYGEEGVQQGACSRDDCPIEAAFRGERPVLKEMEYERKDGSKVWISGSFSVIRNRKRQIENVVCVFRDISEQKRLQHLALVDKELDIASHIQGALLPDGPLENRLVKVLAHQEQARIVGGDWYDYWEEDNRLRLVIGDAAGSGIPAALLATLAMSAIRAEAKYGTDALGVVIKANRAIVPHRLEDRFITTFYCELEMDTLTLRYVNAGHNDPVLIRGGTELITLGSRKRIILGAFEDPDLEEEEVQLEPGDRIFIFTDGVIECRDSRRRMFGENRLRRYLRGAGTRAPVAFVGGLVDTLKGFCGGKMEDDFTILLCDVKKR